MSQMISGVLSLALFSWWQKHFQHKPSFPMAAHVSPKNSLSWMWEPLLEFMGHRGHAGFAGGCRPGREAVDD